MMRQSARDVGVVTARRVREVVVVVDCGERIQLWHKVLHLEVTSSITGKPGGGGAQLLNVRFSQFNAADHLTYWYEDCSSLYPVA